MSRTINKKTTNKKKTKQVIRIIITDDHQVFRQVLRKRIEHEKDMAVVGEAADGKEAVKLTKEAPPDVILMDINMPVMNGIEATRKILAFSNQIRIIGLSMNNDKNISDSMLEAGAVAYESKDCDYNNLCDIIRKVAVKNPE